MGCVVEMVLASFIFAVRRGVYAYAFWQAKGEKAVDVGYRESAPVVIERATL